MPNYRRSDPVQQLGNGRPLNRVDAVDADASPILRRQSISQASPSQHAASSRYPVLAQAMPAMADPLTTLENSTAAAVSTSTPSQPYVNISQPSSGPRLGYFTDARPPDSRPVAATRPQLVQALTSQVPQPPAEVARHRVYAAPHSFPQDRAREENLPSRERQRLREREEAFHKDFRVGADILRSTQTSYQQVASPVEAPRHRHSVQGAPVPPAETSVSQEMRPGHEVVERQSAQSFGHGSMRPPPPNLRHLIDPLSQNSNASSSVQSFGQPQQQSPPYAQEARSTLVLAPPPAVGPPRHAQDPPRRSNISLMLNPEPEEPRAQNRARGTSVSAPSPSTASQACGTYHPLGPAFPLTTLSTSQQSRREFNPNLPIHQQQNFVPPPAAQDTQCAPPEIASREPGPVSSRPEWFGRPNFQQTPAVGTSTPPGDSLPTDGRMGFGRRTPLPSAETSTQRMPTPTSYQGRSHSRNASYTSHSQPISQSQIYAPSPLQHSQPLRSEPQLSEPGAQSLRVNPYAQVVPPQPAPPSTKAPPPAIPRAPDMSYNARDRIVSPTEQHAPRDSRTQQNADHYASNSGLVALPASSEQVQQHESLRPVHAGLPRPSPGTLPPMHFGQSAQQYQQQLDYESLYRRSYQWRRPGSEVYGQQQQRTEIDWSREQEAHHQQSQAESGQHGTTQGMHGRPWENMVYLERSFEVEREQLQHREMAHVQAMQRGRDHQRERERELAQQTSSDVDFGLRRGGMVAPADNNNAAVRQGAEVNGRNNSVGGGRNTPVEPRVPAHGVWGQERRPVETNDGRGTPDSSQQAHGSRRPQGPLPW